MSMKVDSLGAWRRTRNTLVSTLAETVAFQNGLPRSTDPASDYSKADAEMARIENAMREHALNGLKLIDDTIASGTLVQQITAESTRAKQEADRLKRITKTLQEISKVIDTVTGVVTKIAGLPFL